MLKKGKGNILEGLHREQITDPIRSGSMGSACRCNEYDVIDIHCAKTPCIEFHGVLVSNDTREALNALTRYRAIHGDTEMDGENIYC